MFYNNDTYTFLKENVKPIDGFKPCPQLSERCKWENIPNNIKELVINDANNLKGHRFSIIQATDIIRARVGGEWGYFSELYNERRGALVKLLMAECIVNDGEYMNDILNAVWCICEEATWVYPGHYELFDLPGQTELPPHDYDAIDLGAGETGVLLAYTYYLLKDKLDKVCPSISRRIKHELKRRIVDIYIYNRQLWWMGYVSDFVNNWAPWCASNCLMTILLTEEDSELRRLGVVKTLDIMDKFAKNYSEDGGCDEGPTYWGRAGGSLYDCLWIVKLATGMSYYGESKIKNIGEFPAKVHISKSCFLNFADCAPYHHSPYPLLYSFGDKVDSNAMKTLAREMYELKGVYNPANDGVLRGFNFLFSINDIEKLKDATLDSDSDNVFEGIQVVSSRQYPNKGEGLFIGIKGGHNDESHNHNDLGNFIVYYNGSPCIIDIGSGTYVKDTFGPNRYKIWNMQGQYHNIAIIGEHQQLHGKKYEATDFTYSIGEDIVRCNYNLTNAYASEAKVISYHRNMEFDKNKSIITIRDSFNLEQPQIVKLSFMLCKKPEIKKDYVELTTVEGDKLRLSYDHDLEAKVEERELKDIRLINAWHNVYRLQLVSKKVIKDDSFTIKIEPVLQ